MHIKTIYTNNPGEVDKMYQVTTYGVLKRTNQARPHDLLSCFHPGLILVVILVVILSS